MALPSRRALIAAGLTAATAWPIRASGTPDAPTRWGATPSSRQLAWHKLQRYAFIHFSINTFTDREWGYGDESPALFDPTDFSADQIVGAAKAGGFRGIILTAKHHDGFCLWPTQLTEHCVRNSPFRGGKGDVVREFEQASRRLGLEFGIYLSPWDRNHPDYGRPAYIEYYRRQIVELCTRYGKLFEFWFDGANGGDGYYGGARETRKINPTTYYNWPSIFRLVHRYQPMACTFEPLGSDARWVGNEDGIAGDPCWPTMANHKPSLAESNAGLRGGELWWPAETNTSIRPGWFYHRDEDAKVKDPRRLIRLEDESVGRGTNLILNLPPDRRGRLADVDVAVLQSFGAAHRATYATDLTHGAVASASAERGPSFRAGNVLDGRPDTYWSTPDDSVRPILTLDLPPGRSFDLIRISEYLPLGARVTRFALDVEAGNGWVEVASGECIAAQRIVRLSQPVTGKRLRLRVVEAPTCPAISEVALFLQVAPANVVLPAARSDKALPVNGWKVVASSALGAEQLFDGDTNTAWQAPIGGDKAEVAVTIALPRLSQVAGFVLTPSRAVMTDAAPPKRYRLELSRDNHSWNVAAEGEFSNIANALTPQHVSFKAIQAAFVRLTLIGLARPAARVAVAEFQLTKS